MCEHEVRTRDASSIRSRGSMPALDIDDAFIALVIAAMETALYRGAGTRQARALGVA
jgi:hypothetical protein